MYKTTVCIKGMHCKSCELLIEDELRTIKGVDEIEVDYTKHRAVVYHERPRIRVNQIEAAVERAGYEVGITEKKPWFSKSLDDYMDVFHAITGVVALFLLIKVLGFADIFMPNTGKPTSLFAVLLVGLTAGLSTCMALVGGLVLGASANFAKAHPDASKWERFMPHTFFNLGRILSYAIFGGLIGVVGSVFQLSGMSLGIMTIIVAVIMLLMGLQLTNLFPRLEDFKFMLPAGLTRALGISTNAGEGYSNKSAIIMGATTFFLPCGFTQAMQLYAMSTGSFTQGAAIMATFAMGTAPGLLGVGGLTAALKGNHAKQFFKFAGVIVVALSFFNFQNGYNLTGLSVRLPEARAQVLGTDTAGNIDREGKYQVIRMEQNGRGYSPNKLTVVKGVPVKWIVNSTNPNSCAASILASKIGVRAMLDKGENVFEFTPTEVGTIPFSCSMGMYRGTIEVVESEVEVSKAAVVTTAAGGSCGSGGCGCGGGAAKLPDKNAPTVSAAQADNVQVLKTSYTASEDIVPNKFSVKAGKPVRLEVDVKDDGVGCMSSIMIPGLTDSELLTAGEPLKLEFTPKEKGELLITCAMGMPRGLIEVM